MKPDNAAIYERARRLANLAMWSVKLQLRRLQSVEPEDEDFILRPWTDFHFLIMALTRIRRAAELAAKVPPIKPRIREAIRQFDVALPNRKKMRDVAEHIDEYALDRGWDKNVSRKSLEVASCSGETWKWLGYEMDSKEALRASERLYEAIRQGRALLPPQATSSRTPRSMPPQRRS